MKEHLFEELTATRLAVMRTEARAKGRITYDCMNVIVKGDRAVCKKGYDLGDRIKHDLDLLQVLKGKTASACKKCVDYDEEKGE